MIYLLSPTSHLHIDLLPQLSSGFPRSRSTDTTYTSTKIPRVSVMVIQVCALILLMYTSSPLPERLVHGPLTALMLLETAAFHNPGLMLKSLEYRATNPMVVNREMTINGTWLDDSTARLWCMDETGIVGMVGSIDRNG